MISANRLWRSVMSLPDRRSRHTMCCQHAQVAAMHCLLGLLLLLVLQLQLMVCILLSWCPSAEHSFETTAMCKERLTASLQGARLLSGGRTVATSALLRQVSTAAAPQIHACRVPKPARSMPAATSCCSMPFCVVCSCVLSFLQMLRRCGPQPTHYSHTSQPSSVATHCMPAMCAVARATRNTIIGRSFLPPAPNIWSAAAMSIGDLSPTICLRLEFICTMSSATGAAI